MEPTMSIAATLKHATAQAHQTAESRPFQRQLINGTLSPQTLTIYLEQLRFIHAALEQQFDQHAAMARLIHWNDGCRHSRRLQDDIAALADTRERPAPLPCTARLSAQIQSAASAHPEALIGFFYVLEGSMNGNRFIARALRRTPSATARAYSYFDPYGETQPERWRAFREALDALDLDDTRTRALVDAALCMFDGIAQISDAVMQRSDDGAPEGTGSARCPIHAH
jgi:heme oxygenase